MMMPPNWQPGQPLRIPDPADPTKFIEIGAGDIEVVAQMEVPEADGR